ncbi:MAG TPA: TetR/AcrR family transcriptional regulator [Chloroflexia bacterium]|nr:TetR/AcrR family transcriptional regulator [Chloroflexia bacterium]
MPGVAKREVPRDDRRSRRTRAMLGDALVALMLEQRYDTITVQEIIDRANVGRSTFYAHFLDKEDLLQHQITGLITRLSAHMERDGGQRIIPSRELLDHLQASRALYRALVRGRAIEPVLKTMHSQLSSHVETRLRRGLAPATVPVVPLPLLAHHVAAALLTLFQWWLDRDMAETPEQIDAYFVQLVRPTICAATGIEI